MKAFDAEGNEIEVFSKEELDAQIEATKTKLAEDAKAADEAAKKAAEDVVAGTKNDDEMPGWAKTLVEKVNLISSNETKTYLGKVTSGLDADKRKDVEAKYNNLTGYDETPEGLARRSEDAYLLATGQKYQAGTVDMNNLVASGGGKSVVDGAPVAEVDKGLQSLLGITKEDVDKYAKK